MYDEEFIYKPQLSGLYTSIFVYSYYFVYVMSMLFHLCSVVSQEIQSDVGTICNLISRVCSKNPLEGDALINDTLVNLWTLDQVHTLYKYIASLRTPCQLGDTYFRKGRVLI